MKKTNSIIKHTFIYGLIAFSSCAQPQKKNYETPKTYALNQPEEFFLWDVLDEISGIAFSQNNKLYAIEDETGTIYQFTPGEKALLETKFAKKGDYEDIAINQNFITVLKSDGKLYVNAIADINGTEATNTKEFKDLIPKAEYESFAYSKADDLFYVLCKECNIDKKTKATTGYILKMDAAGNFTSQGEFKISEDEIEQLVSLNGKSFRPSAISQKPSSKDWYIVSSINKMLVVTNANWKVKEVYELDGNLFNQPEGLAFDQDENLYISNEGDGSTKKGTLLRFNLAK